MVNLRFPDEPLQTAALRPVLRLPSLWYTHFSHILGFVLAQGPGREMEEPEAKGSIIAWKESPAKGLLGQLPWWLWACSASGTDVEMLLLPQRGSSPSGLPRLRPGAGTEEQASVPARSPEQSCTVHTLPSPPPLPSGQARVGQGHTWRPETEGHPGSEGAREKGCELQGQGHRVRPTAREAVAYSPESGVAGVATGCSRRLQDTEKQTHGRETQVQGGWR